MISSFQYIIDINQKELKQLAIYTNITKVKTKTKKKYKSKFFGEIQNFVVTKDVHENDLSNVF